MITIRGYNDGDYDVVADILREAELFDDVWEDRQNLNNKIASNPSAILVAEEDGRVVGYVSVDEDGFNSFILDLCVRKECRGKGIGESLLLKAEESLKERGAKEACLLVDIKKEELKQWYEKRGYTRTSDYTFMYKPLSEEK